MDSGLIGFMFGFIFTFKCKLFSHFGLSTLVRSDPGSVKPLLLQPTTSSTSTELRAREFT